MTPGVFLNGTRLPARQTAPEVALATSRLHLRTMGREDVYRIAELTQLLQKKDVDAPSLNHKALDELCAHFDAEWQAHGIGHLMILRLEDDVQVGHVYLKWIPSNSGRLAELTYAIDGPHQGQGYATEAVEATLGFAFDRARLDYVVACIEPDNLPSIRVAEKNGMAPVAQGRTHARLMRRFLLPATMWRFHQKQKARAAEAALKDARADA